MSKSRAPAIPPPNSPLTTAFWKQLISAISSDDLSYIASSDPFGYEDHMAALQRICKPDNCSLNFTFDPGEALSLTSYGCADSPYAHRINLFCHTTLLIGSTTVSTYYLDSINFHLIGAINDAHAIQKIDAEFFDFLCAILVHLKSEHHDELAFMYLALMLTSAQLGRSESAQQYARLAFQFAENVRKTNEAYCHEPWDWVLGTTVFTLNHKLWVTWLEKTLEQAHQKHRSILEELKWMS